jgi:hypothetical protein
LAIARAPCRANRCCCWRWCEAGAGGEAVDDVGDGVAVGVVEFDDGGEAVFEAAAGRVERAAVQVVEDEVVEADVECLGEAGERVESGRVGRDSPFYDQHAIATVVATEEAGAPARKLPPAVIGEGMASRVAPFAEANGYETYAGLEDPQKYTSEELLAHNSAQVET